MIYINDKLVREVKVGGANGVTNEPYKFSEIGYTGNEEPLKSGLAYAKHIYDTWDASRTSLQYSFANDGKIIFFPKIDTSNVETMRGMCDGDSNLLSVPELNTHNVTDFEYLCRSCGSLVQVGGLDTSSCTNLSRAFEGCRGLKYINPSNWDVSKVKRMDSVFENCDSIKELDLSQWNTSATSIMGMFQGCYFLSSIKLNIGNNATTTHTLFNNCRNLKYIELKGNPSKITNHYDMFGGSSAHLAENGTLIYDYRYDYSKIIEELHKYNPTWTAKPDNAI